MMVNEKENDPLDEIFSSYSLRNRHQLVVMVFDTNLLAIMGYIVNFIFTCCSSFRVTNGMFI